MSEVTPSPAVPNTRDVEHLRLLAIFHWVYAAIVGLCSLIPLVHVVLGLGMAAASEHPDVRGDSDANALRVIGALFVGFGACIVIFGMAFAICIAWAGRCLNQRTSRTFCFVVAGLMCLCVPLGTVLGVFTLVVLSRESVRALFADQRDGPRPAALS